MAAFRAAKAGVVKPVQVRRIWVEVSQAFRTTKRQCGMTFYNSRDIANDSVDQRVILITSPLPEPNSRTTWHMRHWRGMVRWKINGGRKISLQFNTERQMTSFHGEDRRRNCRYAIRLWKVMAHKLKIARVTVLSAQTMTDVSKQNMEMTKIGMFAESCLSADKNLQMRYQSRAAPTTSRL